MKLRHLPILALILAAVPACWAIDFQSTPNAFVLPANKAVTNELWLMANTIAFNGTALDDCFLLAAATSQAEGTNFPTLRLPGSFSADVWAAGETVEVTGTIANHARLAAYKSLTVDGAIGHNFMGAAPTINLTTNGTIGGDATLAGQDILLYGTINGNTRIYANKVTLAGNFNGNLAVTATEINVMPGTRIAGNLAYDMENDLVLDSRVALGGKMIKKAQVQAKQEPVTTSAMLLQLALLCGAILVGLVFVSLMPGIVALSVHKLSESVWRCILFGFVTFSLVPMTSFFLLFTLVGIPLSIMLTMAYILILYTGKIITGLFVGHLLIRRKTPLPANLLFPVMALGLLILYGATNLPFPWGMAHWFAITLAGMGALVSAIMDRRIPVIVTATPDEPPKPPPMPGAMPPGAV